MIHIHTNLDSAVRRAMRELRNSETYAVHVSCMTNEAPTGYKTDDYIYIVDKDKHEEWSYKHPDRLITHRALSYYTLTWTGA